ncbi:MAG: aminotransferase class I/II-fold pyridoxal phosphate-dependent enzyme [Myxococcota bacterium]|nr:aminotransferase class I/II-fold pyridoxal phosphate-dependent enzyme [Myxococcota bacterium]
MVKFERLNATIEKHAPAAFQMLSQLGRAAAFPDGVPAQSAEAAGCAYNGSIGQFTDGSGNALGLPEMARHFSSLDSNKALLYPPQLGITELREAWAARTAVRVPGLVLQPPMVTVALTHALSLCADLFSDPETTVLVPNPSWGNYSAVFGLRRGATIQRWDLCDREGSLNVEGFAEALSGISGKVIVIFNFPSNPTGYSPTPAEATALARVIRGYRDPMVVITDDAYQGLVHEESALPHSLFYTLLQATSPDKNLLIKVDGATKELAFFGGRVGFLTMHAAPEAGDALYDKAAAIARATVSSAPAPSQMAVLSCLRSPNLDEQTQALRNVLFDRYQKVISCLPMLSEVGVSAYPFNSGCFTLLKLPDDQDPHTLRRRLISEHSVGLIALPTHNALRLAYCSMASQQIEPALERLALAIRN